MKLVPNAKDWHKMWSVRLSVLLTVIGLAEEQWGYFSQLIPADYHPLVMAGFGLAGLVLRLVKQSNVSD